MHTNFLFPTIAMYSAHLILLDLINRKIFNREQIIVKLLAVQLPRIPLTPKDLPQQSILEHSDHMFFPQYDRPCLTSTYNRQITIIVVVFIVITIIIMFMTTTTTVSTQDSFLPN